MGKWTRLGLVAATVITADQLLKLAVLQWLAPVGNVRVIPGLFDLAFVMNSGVAFGMMSGAHNALRVLVLAGLTIFALMVIMAIIYQTGNDKKILLWGLSLVSGGASGNLIDRVRLGGVIDFLDFYLKTWHWPAFNVADSAISLGVGLIILHLWLNR